MNFQDLRRLKKNLRPIVDAFPESASDIESIRAYLEEALGRPVEIAAESLDAETVGGSYEIEGGGIQIEYEQNADPRHQVHVVLHEAAHLLLGHEMMTLADATAQRTVFLSGSLIRKMIHHTAKNRPRETEAEVLAVLLENKIGGEHRFAADGESQAGRRIDRFLSKLG